MGSRIFSVCVIVITFLCVRIVNSDIHIPSTRLRLTGGFSKQIPLKSYPANLKSLRSGIAAGSSQLSSKVKPQSFWSKFFGKSSRGDTLHTAPLASAAVLASHRRNGHSNQTTARKSLRVKRYNRDDKLETTSAPKTPAMTTKQSQIVEKMPNTIPTTTVASGLLTRSTQVTSGLKQSSATDASKISSTFSSKNSDVGKQTMAADKKSPITESSTGSSASARFASTTDKMIATSADRKEVPSAVIGKTEGMASATADRKGEGRNSATKAIGNLSSTHAPTAKHLLDVMASSDHGNLMSASTTVPQVTSKPSFNGTSGTASSGKLVNYVGTLTTTVSSVTIKASLKDEAEITRTTSARLAATATMTKSSSNGTIVVPSSKNSSSESWSATAAKDVTSSAKVTSKSDAKAGVKSEPLMLLSTTKKSLDGGLTLPPSTSKSPVGGNSSLTSGSSTIVTTSGSIGTGASAADSSLLLSGKLNSSNGGSSSFTTKASVAGSTITTAAKSSANSNSAITTRPQTTAGIVTSHNVTDTTTVRSTDSSLPSVAGARSTATPQTNATTVKSNATTLSNITTTSGMPLYQPNTATAKSGSLQGNTSTTKSNTALHASATVARSTAEPQTNTTTSRSATALPSNTTASRSATTLLSNTATTRSATTLLSNTSTSRSAATLLSNTTSSGGNAALQLNTATTKSGSLQGNTSTTESNTALHASATAARSTAEPQTNTTTSRSATALPSNTTTSRSATTLLSNTATTRSATTLLSNTSTSRSAATLLSNTTSSGGNAALQLNTATTKSGSLQGNTSTTKSNTALHASATVARSTAEPQTNTTTSRSATALPSNTTTSRSATTLLSNTVTTRSATTLLSNTSTSRSAATLLSNTTSSGGNAALQTNTATTKSVSPQSNTTTAASNAAPQTSAAAARSTMAPQSNTTMANSSVTSLHANTAATTRSSAASGSSTGAPQSNATTTRSISSQTNAMTVKNDTTSQTNIPTASSNIPLQTNTAMARSTVAPQINVTPTKSAATLHASGTTATTGTNGTKGAVPLPSVGNATFSGNQGNSSRNVTRPKPTAVACPLGQVFCLQLWSCVISHDYYDLETMRWLDGYKDEVLCDRSDVCQPSYCRKIVCKLDEIYSLELDACIKYSSSENEYQTEFPEFPHTTESPIHHLSSAPLICPKGEVYTLPVDVYCRVNTDCPLASKCCYISERNKYKLPSCVWIAEHALCPPFMSYCSTTAKCHLPTEACNATCQAPWVFCNTSSRCVEAGTCKATNSSMPGTFEPFELPSGLLPDLKIKTPKPLLEDCDSRRLVSDMFEIEGSADFPLKIKEKLLLRFLQEHLSWNVDHMKYYAWIANFSAVLSVKESSVEIRSSETVNRALPFVPTAEFPCLDGILLQTAHNINGSNGDLRWSNSHCGNTGLRMKFRNVARLHCRPNYYGKVTFRLSPLVVDVSGNKTYGKTQLMEMEVMPVHDPPALRVDLADVDVEIPFVTAVPLASDPSRDEGTLVKEFTAAYFYNPDGEALGMGVIAAQNSKLGFWEFKLLDGDDWMNITDVDPSCSTLQKLGITNIHQGAVFLDGATPPDTLKTNARSRRSLIFFNGTANATSAPKAFKGHPLSKKSQVEFWAFYSNDFRALAEYNLQKDPENSSDADQLYNITQVNQLSLKNPWRQRHRFASLPLKCPAQPVLDDGPVTAKVNSTTSAYSQTAASTFKPAIGFSGGPQSLPTAAPLTLTTTSKSGLTTTVVLTSSSVASWNSAASASGNAGAGFGSTAPSSPSGSPNSATVTISSSGTTKSGSGQSSISNSGSTATGFGNSSTTKAGTSASVASVHVGTTRSSGAQSASSNSTYSSGNANTTSAVSGNSTTGNFSLAPTSGTYGSSKLADYAATKPVNSATTNAANSASTASSVTTARLTSSSSANSANSGSAVSLNSSSTANPANSATTAKSANSTLTSSVNITTTSKSVTYTSTNSMNSTTTKPSNSATTTSANSAYSATTTKSSLTTTNSANPANNSMTSGASHASTTGATKPGHSYLQSTLSSAAASGRASTAAANVTNAAFVTTAKPSGSAANGTTLSSVLTSTMPTKTPFWPDEDEVVAKEIKLVTQILFLPPTARLRFVPRNATSVRWWSILSAMTGSKLAFLAWDGSDRRKAGSRQQVTTTLCTMQNEECTPHADASLSSHVAVVRRRPLDCTSQSSLMVRRVVDQCGVCGGNGRICQDCSGTVGGDAVMDCSGCVGGNTGKPLYGGRDCDFQCSKTSSATFGSSCFTSGDTSFKRCDQKSNVSFIDECGQCTVAQNHSAKADAESSLCGHCADQHETMWLKNHYFKYFNCDHTWKKDSMVEAVAFGPHPHLRWDTSPEFGQAVYADLATFSGPVLLLHVYGPSWSYKKDVFESASCDLVNFPGVVVASLRSVLLTDRLQIELMIVELGDYRIACRMMTPNKNYYSLTPISKLTVVDSRRVWIQSCTPSSIKAKQNATLTIVGEGFVNSLDLTCFIFVHPSKVATFLSKANFVNEGKVTCNVSSTALESSTTIDVGVALSSLALGQFNAGRFPSLSTITVEVRVDDIIHLLGVHISNDWREVVAKFDCNVQFENCYAIFSDMTDIFGKNISCKAKADTITIYSGADLEGLVGKAIHTSKTNDVSCIFAPKSVPGAILDAVIQKPPNEVPLSFELIGPSQVCSGNASFQVVALTGTGGKPVITRWKIKTNTNSSDAGKDNVLLNNATFPSSALNVTIPSNILSAELRYVVEVTVANFLKQELSRFIEFAFSSACEAGLTIVGPAVVNPQHDVFLTAQVTLSPSSYYAAAQPQLTFYWEISGSLFNINNARSSTVMIEKGSLEGGMIYIVQCLVILNGDPTKAAVGSFNLSTSLGNPVALTSVTFLDVPVTKGFWLKGDLSHDPYKPSKKLRFLWSCSSEKDGACYTVTNFSVRRLESLLNFTIHEPNLAIDGHLLAVGSYNFTLTVLTADGRQAKTFVRVKILPTRNAPTIAIAQGNDFAVRPGSEITLRAFITAPAGTALLWQCLSIQGNAYFDVSTSPSSGSCHLIESNVVDMPFTTTLRSSIEPTDPWWTRLMPDSQYMLSLTASHPIEGTMRAYVTLKTVSSPTIIPVQVLPASGVAIFTIFSIDISEFWMDKSASHLQIGFREESQNDTTLRYLRQVNQEIPSVDIRLPAVSLTSGKLVVIIKACSSDDVCSLSKSGSVQVKMPDLSTKESLKAIVNTVIDIVSRGDFATAVAHATSCIHTLYIAGYRRGATLQRLVWITELLLRRQAARIEISVDDTYSPRDEAFDTLSAACSAFKDVRPSNHTLISLMALQSKMMDAYVRQQLEIDVSPTSKVPSDGPVRIPYGSTTSPVFQVGVSGRPNGTTISISVTKGFTSVSSASSSVTSSEATGLKSSSAGTTATSSEATSLKGSAGTVSAISTTNAMGREETTSASYKGSSTNTEIKNTIASSFAIGMGSTSARPLVNGTGSTSARPLVNGAVSTSARPLVNGTVSTSARPLVNGTGSTSATSARPLVNGTGSSSARPLVNGTGSSSAIPLVNGTGSTSARPLVNGAGSTSATSARPLVNSTGSTSATSARPLVNVTGSSSARPLVNDTGSTSATSARPLVNVTGSSSARPLVNSTGSTSATPLVNGTGSSSASPLVNSTGSSSAIISASGPGNATTRSSHAATVASANGSLNKTMALEKGPDSSVHIDKMNDLEKHMHDGYVKQIVDGLKRLFRIGRSIHRKQSKNKNSGSGGGPRPSGSQNTVSFSVGSKSSANSNQQAAKPAAPKPMASSGTPERKLDTLEKKAVPPQAKAEKLDQKAEVPEKKDAKPHAKDEKQNNKAEAVEKRDVKSEAKADRQAKKVEKQESKKSEKNVKKYEKQAKKYDKKADKFEKQAEKSKKKAEKSREKAEKAKAKAEKSEAKTKKEKNDRDASMDLDVRNAANGRMAAANNPAYPNYGLQQRRPRGTTAVFVLPSTNHRRYRYRRAPTKPGLLPGVNSPAHISLSNGEIGGNAYLVSEPNQPISSQQVETLLGITDLALAAGSASPAALYQQLLADLPDLWMVMCLGAMPNSKPIVAVSNNVVLQVAKADADKALSGGGNYPFVDAGEGSKGFVRSTSYFHLDVTSKMNATDFDCNGGQSDCGIVCLGSAHFKKDPLTTALGLLSNNPSAVLSRGNIVALLPVFYADSQEISLLDVANWIGLNISVDREDVTEAEIPYLKCAAWSNDRFFWNTGLCNTSDVFRSTNAIRVSCTCSPTGFFGLYLDRAQAPFKAVAETTTRTTPPVTPKTNPTTATTKNPTNATTMGSANATTMSATNATGALTTSATTQPKSVPSSALNPSYRKYYQVGFAIDGEFNKIVLNKTNFIHLMTEQLAALLNITVDTFTAVTVEKGSVKVTMIVTPDPNSQYGDGSQLVDHIQKLIEDKRFCFIGENNETLCARKDSYSMTHTNNEEIYKRQSMVGTIVGAVFGAVIGIVALCILRTFIRNKMRKNKIAAMQASMVNDAESSANYKHLQNAPTIPQTYKPIEGTIDSRDQYRMSFAPSPNMVPNADGSFNYPSFLNEDLDDDPSDDYLQPAPPISTFVHPAEPSPVKPDHPTNPNTLSENPQHDKRSSTLVNVNPIGNPKEPDHAAPAKPHQNPPPLAVLASPKQPQRGKHL